MSKDERERDLADDEQGAGLALAEAGAGAVAALFKSGVEVGARGTDGGEETEEDAGDERDDEGEGEDAPVDADGGSGFADAWDVAGVDGEKPAHTDVAEDETEDAAGEGEEDAFGKQLTDDVSAACAERDADGELALASCGADEEEICDVGAGDEEDESDSA